MYCFEVPADEIVIINDEHVIINGNQGRFDPGDIIEIADSQGTVHTIIVEIGADGSPNFAIQPKGPSELFQHLLPMLVRRLFPPVVPLIANSVWFSKEYMRRANNIWVTSLQHLNRRKLVYKVALQTLSSSNNAQEIT